MKPTATNAETSHRSVEVALDGRSYNILIGPDLLTDAGRLIAPYLSRQRTTIITDETVAGLHLDSLTSSLESSGVTCRSIVLPAGEATKSFTHLEHICCDLLEAGLERGDRIVALGGGVIGDLAGFAAAVALRGIDFIQVPTTLLAQVDSSVGGKTGINTPQGKNLVGSFHQPLLVLADTTMLATLDDRQLRSGYAEVAKYGLLGDEPFFAWLEENAARLLAGDRDAQMTAIEKSCRAKAAIVAQDEREHGVRALLNLGHTFGHAFEAAAGYSDRLLHGEAVALGMAMAFRMSHEIGLCGDNTAGRVESHLRSVGLPTRPADLDMTLPGTDTLMNLMGKDKKASGGHLTFILVHGVGEAFVARDIERRTVHDFLERDLRSQ